jgi:hypothetical protein
VGDRHTSPYSPQPSTAVLEQSVAWPSITKRGRERDAVFDGCAGALPDAGQHRVGCVAHDHDSITDDRRRPPVLRLPLSQPLRWRGGCGCHDQGVFVLGESFEDLRGAVVRREPWLFNKPAKTALWVPPQTNEAMGPHDGRACSGLEQVAGVFEHRLPHHPRLAVAPCCTGSRTKLRRSTIRHDDQLGPSGVQIPDRVRGPAELDRAGRKLIRECLDYCTSVGIHVWRAWGRHPHNSALTSTGPEGNAVERLSRNSHAELLQQRRRVRPEIETEACCAQFVCTLKDPDVMAVPVKCQSSGQTRYARADNGNLHAASEVSRAGSAMSLVRGTLTGDVRAHERASFIGYVTVMTTRTERHQGLAVDRQ